MEGRRTLISFVVPRQPWNSICSTSELLGHTDFLDTWFSPLSTPSGRTSFSLVIFISQRNLVSFRQFYTKSKDRSTAAVTRAQNTLQRVILFRNLHRRNYFSRAIRREKNKKKKLKIDHRLRERLTEFSTRRTLFEFYPRRFSRQASKDSFAITSSQTLLKRSTLVVSNA